jgi:predicted Rossmann fold nucleotide-binding protein DprA/Smf involved in DNA uptake
MKELESFLKTVGDGLRALAQGIGSIAEKLDTLADDQADEKPKRKASKKKPAVKRTRKTTTPGKKAPTATDVVYKAIGSSKEGVNLATLEKKTGFKKSKIHNAIYRLKKQGKVRSVGRGVYMKT